MRVRAFFFAQKVKNYLLSCVPIMVQFRTFWVVNHHWGGVLRKSYRLITRATLTNLSLAWQYATSCSLLAVDAVVIIATLTDDSCCCCVAFSSWRLSPSQLLLSVSDKLSFASELDGGAAGSTLSACWIDQQRYYWPLMHLITSLSPCSPAQPLLPLGPACISWKDGIVYVRTSPPPQLLKGMALLSPSQNDKKFLGRNRKRFCRV